MDDYSSTAGEGRRYRGACAATASANADATTNGDSLSLPNQNIIANQYGGASSDASTGHCAAKHDRAFIHPAVSYRFAALNANFDTNAETRYFNAHGDPHASAH